MILIGDVREKLATLPRDSVHCCITSPPYFQLRDYGVDGQIGLEKTPEEFIANLVAVFREVKRVLHPSGVCFINIGDSYNAYNHNRGPSTSLSAATDASRPDSGWTGSQNDLRARDGDCLELLPVRVGESEQKAARPRKRSGTGKKVLERGRTVPHLKPKDLCLIPWRLVLALQMDGWYVRDIIVWHKPAPMPESVTDRCTKAWEPIFELAKTEGEWAPVFQLAKNERYFWDQVAVKEKADPSSLVRVQTGWNGDKTRGHPSGRQNNMDRYQGSEHAKEQLQSGCNPRNVWTIAPTPYAEAHFATFPEGLPERCIKAGTSERGCCPKCLAPWRRVTNRAKLKRERPNEYTKRQPTSTLNGGTHEPPGRRKSKGEQGGNKKRKNADVTPRLGATSMLQNTNTCGNTVAGVSVETTGWEPTCSCGIAETIPCTVLDCFGGSGTTGRMARLLGRKYILCELNPEYAEMAERRINAPLEKMPAIEPLNGQKQLF